MNWIQKVNTRIAFIAAVFISTLWISCNNPSFVGSELLDQDGVEVVFTDTTTLITLIVEGTDSIKTNDGTMFTTDAFVGEIDDPFFGTQKYDAFLQVGLGSSVPKFYDFTNNAFATIDSIIMILNVDTSLIYGNEEALHDIEVHLLEMEVDDEAELYTFDDLPAQMTPISEIQDIVISRENYEIRFEGDSSLTTPAIRIKLDDAFGQMIINDTTFVKSDTLLRDILTGFKISSTPSESSVIPLDLGTKPLAEIGNKLLVFYTDTVPKLYSFPLGGVRHNFVQQDHSGTALESAFNNSEFSDSLIFIQGFGGADLKIDIPYANYNNYKDILVKKAVIEVTVADLSGDNDKLTPIPVLTLTKKDDSGERVSLEDVILALTSNLGLQTGFGGVLQEEEDDNGVVIRRFYTFNVTNYFQNLIDLDSNQSSTIYMEAAIPEISPGRSILYGPGNSVNPMRLNITYSIPK